MPVNLKRYIMAAILNERQIVNGHLLVTITEVMVNSVGQQQQAFQAASSHVS